ncbi:hypothetical protein ZWY2020_006372, partial [Hordeum vulgare]
MRSSCIHYVLMHCSTCYNHKVRQTLNWENARILIYESSGHVMPSLVEKTTFKWRIDGFSSLLDKDGRWIYSTVSIDKNECVSLRLELDRKPVKSDSIVEASFKFLIYDRSDRKNHQNQGKLSTSSGTSCMIPLNTLKKHSSGFIVNNSCVFGVEFMKI